MVTENKAQEGSGDVLDIFASRADSPEPSSSSTPAINNPFDPLSPASKPVDDDSSKKKKVDVDGSDLLSQIMDWGAKNHAHDDDDDDDRTPKETKEGDNGDDQEEAKKKVNPNVMAARDDAAPSIESLMSDEDIAKIQKEIQATHLDEPSDK